MRGVGPQARVRSGERPLAYAIGVDYPSCVSTGIPPRTPGTSGSTGSRSRRHRTLLTSGSDWLDLDDEAHSEDELRYRAVGPIARGVVVVVYVERKEDVLRVISARLATPTERRLYTDWIKRNL